MKTKQVQRRKPYNNPEHDLPADYAENGYIQDLITEIRSTSDAMKAQVSFVKKNKDYYLTVLIPRPSEIF